MSEFKLLGKEPFRNPPPPKPENVLRYVLIEGTPIREDIPLFWLVEPERVHIPGKAAQK